MNEIIFLKMHCKRIPRSLSEQSGDPVSAGPQGVSIFPSRWCLLMGCKKLWPSFYTPLKTIFAGSSMGGLLLDVKHQFYYTFILEKGRRC